MRSVKYFGNKLIITWHQVKRKLYVGYIFIVRTFDFGQTHVQKELELILTLACRKYGQPDYLNRKHISTFRIAYSQAQSVHFKLEPCTTNPSFIENPITQIARDNQEQSKKDP